MEIPQQRIVLPLLEEKGIELYIKRLDRIDQAVTGNKYFKLKYNLKEAQRQGQKTLLTFGGAYSNHILATSLAGKAYQFNTIGIIRGEELADKWNLNPTLRTAATAGMQFKFIGREQYRNRSESAFVDSLKEEFGRFYLLPEGGTNHLAIKGCEEILNKSDLNFNWICCSVGTGGTIAGIVNSSCENQRVLGFPSLKGNFLKEDICKFTPRKNWDLSVKYHFGGYAKMNIELIEFINYFRRKTQIALDPVYTAKMLFGILDLTKRDFFKPGASILAIHSGGLQGIEGMNELLKKKNLPLIGI